MNVLPEFRLIRPKSVEQALQSRSRHPGARLLGGGTDLIVNIRRGIGNPPSALIDLSGIGELQSVAVDGDAFRIGAGVKLDALARHCEVRRHLPILSEAACSIAGPTHRNMGTLGGNLCLDTRCVFYNQSEWWRASNDYCLKYAGSTCYVAPGSKSCYATFSGDLAPALLVLASRVEIVGPEGRRDIPLSDLYTGDGENYLSLGDGEFVCAVSGKIPSGWRCAYEKIRVRRSIEFPLAGVAVALRREGEQLARLRVAFTGTNPRPLLLEGTDALCGGPLDDEALNRFDALVRRQVGVGMKVIGDVPGSQGVAQLRHCGAPMVVLGPAGIKTRSRRDQV